MTTPTAEHVTQLNPGDVPPGEVRRYHLELMRDPLSNPICIPVMIARGVSKGPVFGITAAVHGNEVNGIPIIQRLFAELDPTVLRGTVIGVPVVSAYAFVNATRTFLEGFDLNRIMPGRHDGNVGQVYANRVLERLVKHFHYFVDVHTASFGRVNSLYVRADLRDARSRRMAFLQSPEIIVHNEARDGTLRDAAMELGIAAITVEVGDPLRFQRRMIRDSLFGIRAILHEFGFIPSASLDGTDDPPVVCSHSRWIYADGGGLLEVLPNLADHVRANDPIARLRNPFGDVLTTYTAPFDAVVVGKSTNPVCRTGSRIVHLGVPSNPDDVLDEDAPTSPSQNDGELR